MISHDTIPKIGRLLACAPATQLRRRCSTGKDYLSRSLSHVREHAMGVLRLAVLGYPEAFHDSNRLTFSLRKALALLIYLAVERGMYPRSKLAAFLWPDSEPH